MTSETDADDVHDDIIYPSTIPFILVHLGCFAAIWTGVTWTALILCVSLYWIRIFAIGAGYHRYFSHRAFSTSRAFQFILAFVAQTTTQKSVIWWASKHRHHHLYSDTVEDVHSPRHKGFIYSHLGWIFARKHDGPDLAKVTDLTRYPELMWLHKLEIVPGIMLAGLCYLIGGWSGFGDSVVRPITDGVLAGLVIGKPVGVWLTAFLLAKFTGASLDDDLAWRDVLGVSLLAGIGFVNP